MLPSLLPFEFCAAGPAQIVPTCWAKLVPVIAGVIVPPLSPSEALGAVHCTDSSLRFRIPWPSAFFAAILSGECGGKWSRACGAAQFLAAAVSVSDTPRATRLPALSESSALALGQDEQSLAPHGVSGLGRAEYSCRNAVAQSLQWRDDGRKLLAGVPRHVLAEDKIRPALVGDTDDLGGEKPGSIGSSALAGNAVVLAGISRSEDMNEATPRSSVEGGKVGPDRSRMKPPCFHRRDQAGGGRCFSLHVADASCSLSPAVQGKGDAKFEPADAGTEGYDVSGAYSHVTTTTPSPLRSR